MTREITLTPLEKTLRQLLLDVSDYIGCQDGCTKPELRFTGGWVRDKLLGTTSKDIDIGISSMTGFQFGSLMKQYLADPERKTKYGQDVLGGLAKIEANPEKSKHLETVTTKILGLEIDLVNLRKETYGEDSRNPTMEFGSPKDDALRRDATVNALFYNLTTSEVEDFTKSGLADMDSGIIRTPLSPYQTFKDDPLRILRCIRFASKLGYSIDPEAQKSMSDKGIKDALRGKITRERVGIEIEKTLRGPDPYQALCLIDRLGLYDTIFTDPTKRDIDVVDTNRWSRAYEALLDITKPIVPGNEGPWEYRLIRETIIRDSEELYLSWLLSALVPWAKVEPPLTQNGGTKSRPPLASIVAREGLKCNNKTFSVVKNALAYMGEISMFKDAVVIDGELSGPPLKRKSGALDRGVLGMAIRRWGPHWRSSVMFSLLLQVMDCDRLEDRQHLIRQYAAWLSKLRDLDILDADSIEPIVDGEHLKKAFHMEGGKWLVAAKNIAMEWQLRNPENVQAEDGVAEVIRRKSELGLP